MQIQNCIESWCDNDEVHVSFIVLNDVRFILCIQLLDYSFTLSHFRRLFSDCVQLKLCTFLSGFPYSNNNKIFAGIL